MYALHLFRTLGPIDLKNIGRDAMLTWLPWLALLPALLVRWSLPGLTTWTATTFDLDLVPYYPLILSYFVALLPSVVGMIVGFLLLDERDEHTLTALLVTPLPVAHYLIYRISIPILLSVGLTIAALLITGIAAIPLFYLLLASLLASLYAPIMALFLAAFAENKVAGFALVKAVGGLGLIPTIAYFIDSPWQVLAGIIPPYWPFKMIWLLTQGNTNIWPYLIAGLLVNSLIIAFLLHRFLKVAHR